MCVSVSVCECEFECGVELRDVAWLTLLYWSALHSILSMREALSFSLDILIYTIFLSYIIFPFLFSFYFFCTTVSAAISVRSHRTYIPTNSTIHFRFPCTKL